MELTWYGLSCFKMVESNSATVVTDPYDHRQTGYNQLKLSADIVTLSHDSPRHSYIDAIQGTPYVITGPGEYEVGGVFITGIQTGSQNESGSFRNTLYVFSFDSLTVAHLGDLSRVPLQPEIEAIGTVNIALVPVGSGSSLNAARAAEVISLLEPNIVVPMHYATPESKIPLEPLNRFLKEMGISEYEPRRSLKVSSGSLPEETQVIILDNNHG